MQKVGLRHKTSKFCQRHSKKKEGSTVLHVSWLRNTYLPSIWPAIGLWTWVWEGLQLVSDCSGGWDSVGRCGSWHRSELRQLAGVWGVCFCLSMGLSLAGCSLVHSLVFLMDENHAQANAKSTLCSNCSLVSIALEQICVFKTNYSRTHCTFSISISSCFVSYTSVQFANRSCAARRAFLSLYLKIRMSIGNCLILLYNK